MWAKAAAAAAAFAAFLAVAAAAKDDSKPASPPPSPPSSPPPRRLVAGAASPPFVATALPPFAAAASPPSPMPAISALVTALTIVADAACPSMVIVRAKNQPPDELLGSHTHTRARKLRPIPCPRAAQPGHMRVDPRRTHERERRA